MLPQKLSNIAKLSRDKVFQFSSVLKVSTTCIKFSERLKERAPGQMKNVVEKPFVKEDQFRISTENSIFSIFQAEIEITPQGIKKFVKTKIDNVRIKGQKSDFDRNKVLGPDLSLAYFLIYNGGKVKFKGKDEWISLTNKTDENLPSLFDPKFIIEEIDVTNVLLYYEALENMKDTPRIKRAIFTGSPLFDDWFLDKISTSFPRLEFLDISDCPKVTERGLEALYRTSTLKNLIVTNQNKSAAFELTCMMLEDVIPGLEINIREPKNVT